VGEDEYAKGETRNLKKENRGENERIKEDKRKKIIFM
jgi:hypothetical protein